MTATAPRTPAPFLKWAGGKARLAPLVVQRAPASFGRYFEPFLGGGAVFFALRAARGPFPAVLADANAELVESFIAVRDQDEALAEALAALEAGYLALSAQERRAFYEGVRATLPETPLARAARLIFLNHTCYNGLYRVNSRGLFNVPHGRYARPRIADRPRIAAAARALAGSCLRAADFEGTTAEACAGDFVYFDPPYYPLSATARFTAYTGADFGPADHERLRDAFENLTRRGVAAMLSNSDHQAVRALYEGLGYGIEVVPMARAINSVGSGRAPVGELLVDNFARLAAGS